MRSLVRAVLIPNRSARTLGLGLIWLGHGKPALSFAIFLMNFYGLARVRAREKPRVSASFQAWRFRLKRLTH
jgi:hypothetical protein